MFISKCRIPQTLMCTYCYWVLCKTAVQCHSWSHAWFYSCHILWKKSKHWRLRHQRWFWHAQSII